jgi:hypothetical protein
MDTDIAYEILSEMLRSLGRSEGQLIEMGKVPARVSALEQCQSWLKGGWAVLLAVCACLCKAIYEK